MHRKITCKIETKTKKLIEQYSLMLIQDYLKQKLEDPYTDNLQIEQLETAFLQTLKKLFN